MIAKKFDITKLLAPMVLVILYGFFSVFGNNFFSTDYLINILDGSYYIGFMAIGVTFVIITGGIDLSLGTTMMCAALIGGMAYNNWHWPMGWCLALVLVVATLIGLLNGIMVAYMGLPPFIATLGTQMMGMGFGAIVTKVQTMRYPTFGTADGWFKNFFYKTTTGFPVGILWLSAATRRRRASPASRPNRGWPAFTPSADSAAVRRACFTPLSTPRSFPAPVTDRNSSASRALSSAARP